MVSTRSQVKNNTKPVSTMQLRQRSHPVRPAGTSLHTTIWHELAQQNAALVAEANEVNTEGPDYVKPDEVDAVEPAYVKPEEDSTAAPASATATATPTGASPTKSKRVRKMPEYKSIVRTRSQKLKEAEVYHERQLERLAQHWYIMRREPKIDSPYGDESELAVYIQNLRAIHPENLKSEFVARVTEVLPWFKWHVPEKTTWCATFGWVATFGGLIAVTLGAAYVQVKLQDRQTMNQVLLMLNELRARAASYA
jgi:hypothetical protein